MLGEKKEGDDGRRFGRGRNRGGGSTAKWQNLCIEIRQIGVESLWRGYEGPPV